MDLYAIFLHSAEPGHLALGELMDGITQQKAHLIVGQDAQHVLGHELIFQTVIHQVFGTYSAVQKALDLFNQSVL